MLFVPRCRCSNIPQSNGSSLSRVLNVFKIQVNNDTSPKNNIITCLEIKQDETALQLAASVNIGSKDVWVNIDDEVKNLRYEPKPINCDDNGGQTRYGCNPIPRNLLLVMVNSTNERRSGPQIVLLIIIHRTHTCTLHKGADSGAHASVGNEGSRLFVASIYVFADTSRRVCV